MRADRNGLGVGGRQLPELAETAVDDVEARVAAEAGPHAHAALPRLLNVMGHVGLLALVTAWLVVLQWFVFAPETLSVFRQVPAWMRAALVGIVWALWLLLTAGNGQMANSSSLHSFYRARLTRAYLAVGNRRRALDGHAPGAADNVTVVVDGDDTALGHYRPEAQGGPIHLVNTCLNQTRDDRSGLYNADRKGAAVTASWRGLEVGPAAFMALRQGDDAGTLGRWVAVSGAASSPGAGSYTSRGLALLVYFLGVRLGHWVRAPHPRVQLRWLSRFGWRFCPKPLMLASEASANPGQVVTLTGSGLTLSTDVLLRWTDINGAPQMTRLSPATVAADVWMRPWLSVAGTRCTRCTPLSYFRRL